jgi:arylsulfatase A
MSKNSQKLMVKWNYLLRTVLITSVAGLSVVAAWKSDGILPWASIALAANPPKPNVVIILCDDLGYGDLGVYGSKAISTPNIDRLAQGGIRFTNFYSCNGICAPSRAGLLTGRYPLRSGVIGNLYPKDEPFRRTFFREYIGGTLQKLGLLDLREKEVVSGIPKGELLLGEALQGAGYTTGMVGKWHLGNFSIEPSYNPHRNGFDFFLGVPHSNDMFPCPLFRNEEMLESNIGYNQARLTGLYAKEAIEFIKGSKGKPFFLYFASTFPHQPLYASEKFKGKSKAGIFGDAVEEIDWSVGRLMETLREMGVENNTLVFFTSDNGPWFEGSAGPFRGRKGQSYEGGFHVPMIANWPGHIPAGIQCDASLMNIDLYPTILALAGVDLPKDRIIDGRNIYEILSGKTTKSPHGSLFFYHFDLLEGVRVGNWKYFRKLNRYVWPVPLDAAPIANKMGKDQLGDHRWPLLYNLETDPGENYNVIDTYPEKATELEIIMEEWESSSSAKR